MIYLNNASTTYPKPEAVVTAVEQSLVHPPFAQNRAAYNASEDIFAACRKKLALLFHIENEKRIYFTSGATDAFNRIVRAFSLKRQQIVITEAEHNAVLRPIYNFLPKETVKLVKCNADGNIDLKEFSAKITEQTAAVFVNHCSNVTGSIAPIQEMSKIVHQKNATFIVDASQSAGVLDIDVEEMGIDILVFTGHKGLYGPQGTGGFYVSPDLFIKPSVYGGTGVDSHLIRLPEDYDEQEAGTQNTPGISGLCAGVAFVQQTGVAKIREKESRLIDRLRNGLNKLTGVTVFGTKEQSGAILSFQIDALAPKDAAYILANSYHIVLRSGLSCAPLMHQALGTGKSGALRASVSWFNTEEIDALINAVKELANAL